MLFDARSRPVFTRFVAATLIVFSASPALASGSIQIPEPGDAALFVIAVVGLIAGRHASRRAPRDNSRPDDTQV
jgi:hypothetical protein